MYKRLLLPFIVSFAFLNFAVAVNILVFKLFLAFDFQPFFLETNFKAQTLINLYIFLATVVNISVLHLAKIENTLFRIAEITLAMLFFVFYCDILMLETLDSLFLELTEKKDLIKLQ